MDEQPTGADGTADPASAAVSQGLARVESTLDHLGHLCARLEHAEQRFKQMTDECGSVLQGLVAVDRRHATTLAALNDRLGDWCSIERKLLEESARRIERFERGVEREWMALRRLHEEPIEDLRDQADKLRAACLDAARLVRERLDAADRDHALQAVDLERRLADWSDRLVQAAAARAMIPAGDPRAGVSAQQVGFAEHGAPAPVDPWPLDGVVQLHQELRTGPPPSRPRYTPAAAGGGDPKANPVVEVSPPVPAEAVDAKAPLPVPSASRPRRRFIWIGWAALVIVVGIVVGTYVNQMQHRMVDLESKTLEATRQANASREAAAPTIANARESAERAGLMTEILAAPDLYRFALAGVGAGQGAYGQVLWSRSRGMALTAVGLHAPPGGTYRVWVIDNTLIAAAGNLTVGDAATARLIVPGPLTLPRPGSIAVTLETNGSASRPTGPICLTRTPAG